MKKNLFWSLLAATAMLTACGDDALVDQPVVTGPETAVAFKINMGNGIQTYATDVAKGGWTNYKDGKLADFYARATVQVFAAGSTTTAPLAEARTVLQTVPGATGDVINVDNLRLPAGATYTAVVWVDFIKNTASKVGARNDYYWDTENLSAVKDLRMVNSMEGNLELIDGTDSPESRDAYTSTLTFTVNANGTYQADDQAAGTDNTTALEIQARRTLAKVSLVLTDYDTKEAWANAFNNVDANRKLDYLAMGVTNLATEYNALTQQPKVTNAAYYFHRKFTIPADKDATDVNGVKWIKEGSKFYPVMDFNYVIPAVAEKNSANAVYSLVFKGYNHGTAAAGFTATEAALTDISTSTIANNWKLVAKRNASSVPVRTNAHTIIKLNLYKEYSCNVTIVDLFDGGKENVTVNDDNTKSSEDDHYINENGPINDGNTTGAAHVVVVRGNDGIATSITITDVTAANFDKVMEDIEAMAQLGAVDINMTAITIPANADFSEVPASNKVVLTVTAQNVNTALSGMKGNIDLNITPDTGQTPTVTATSSHTVTFVGGTYEAAVIVDAENANFTNGTYKAAVIVDAENANFTAGTYEATVTINENKPDKNASISGGTYAALVSSYSNTSISGGSSSITGPDPAFLMANETDIKTVKVSNSVFGKLNAHQFSSSNALLNHVLDFQNNNSLYNSYNTGGYLITNFNCINTADD